MRSLLRWAKAWAIAAIIGRYLFMLLVLIAVVAFLVGGGEIHVAVRVGE